MQQRRLEGDHDTVAVAPGGDIARLVQSFPGLQMFRCDGTDYLALDTYYRDKNLPGKPVWW